MTPSVSRFEHPTPDGSSRFAPPPGSPYPGAAPPDFYPITAGRAVRLAFSLFRFGWRTFVAIQLAIAIPITIITSVSGYLLYEELDAWRPNAVSLPGVPTAVPAEPFPWGVIVVVLALSLLSAPISALGGAALIEAGVTSIAGGRPGTAAAYRFALSRFFDLLLLCVVLAAVGFGVSLLGIAFPIVSGFGAAAFGLQPGPLTFLALIAAVAVFVGVVYALIRLVFAIQVLVVERLGAADALRRSWFLVGGSMLRVIGWSLLFGLVLGLLGLAIGFVAALVALVIAPPTVTAQSITFSPLANVIETLVSTFISLLIAPIATLGLTLLYLDIRWRHGEQVPAPGRSASG